MLSELESPTLETTVFIPMRDGIRLSADIYFPPGSRTGLPVILTRTPYDKRSFRKSDSEAWRFAGAGFVYVVQDLRGTFESEGRCRVSEHERDDGYDTVQWIAAQPWCNGRVGTYGCSQRGEVQLQLGAMRPPALACMVAQAAASVLSGETSRSYVHVGGAVNLAIAGWYRRWMHILRPQFPVGATPEMVRQAADCHDLKPQLCAMEFGRDLSVLPIIDILDRVDSPPNEWRDLVSHHPGDSWWKRKGHLTRDDRLDVPILHINSWFDPSVNETLVAAGLIRDRSLSELSRSNQFTIISAAAHCESEKLKSGDRMGELLLGDPTFDFFGLYLDWFRHWLLGEPTDFPQRPRYQYFLLNGNRWRSANQWPPEDAEALRFYLDSDGRANSLSGDGRLYTTSARECGADSFQYDPMNPVPTRGGPWAPGEPPVEIYAASDQSEVQAREDVLVYTSAPFGENRELAGPLVAELYVRSSAPDTDFTAKLTYVTPEGKPLWLTDGILRLRYWAGLDAPRFVEPGTIARLRIDLRSTAFWFEAGSRLRLEVSSSNFPRFERNLNTGGNNFDECKPVVATNEILHGPAYPSHVQVWFRPLTPAPEHTRTNM
jgi:putative CocE/NonD family hydrolase